MRDLVLSQGHRQVSHEGSHQLWHLHGATKSQAESVAVAYGCLAVRSREPMLISAFEEA
ncbi:MAG: hypothetical protein R2865_12185 [Deinococcales bacterium]